MNNQVQMFFYDQHKQSILDLSEQSAKFLWLQLFKDVIFMLPPDDNAKQEMISECRRYYEGNQAILQQIDKFNDSYCEKECILWYTKPDFLHKTINGALRPGDIDQLYIFRYYMANLSRQLYEHQNSKGILKVTNNLYRGMIITTREAETLKANKNKLIATNTYWSTSRNESCTLAYIVGHKNNADEIAALFEIEFDVQNDNHCVIFADIREFSHIPTEDEVLFDIGAVFEIKNITDETRENTDVLVVQMTPSGEGRKIVEGYREENRIQMKEESPKIMLCVLQKRIGNVGKSFENLKKLLENPGDENLTHIHNRIGTVLRAQNDYNSALEHFKQAYELAIKSDAPQRKYTALILYNMGRVYDKTKQFKEALRVSEEAVKILEEVNDKNGNIAKLYSSIGRIYYHQENLGEALNYQRKALEIRKQCLSSKHVVIAFTYADIGNIFQRQKNYDDALYYHDKALNLRKNNLPSDHHSIAWSLQRVGKIYKKKNNSKFALQYYQASLEISEKCISTSTSLNNLILDTLKGIISIYDGKSSESLEYRLKALNIRRTIQSTDDLTLAQNLEKIASTLADDLDGIARKYKVMGNLNESLSYYKKAVETRENQLPNDYCNLACSLYGLASVYEKMGEHTNALVYYNREMKIYTDNCGYDPNHKLCRTAQDNIDRMKQLIEEKKNS